jgi:hypothetical protein
MAAEDVETTGSTNGSSYGITTAPNNASAACDDATNTWKNNFMIYMIPVSVSAYTYVYWTRWLTIVQSLKSLVIMQRREVNSA